MATGSVAAAAMATGSVAAAAMATGSVAAAAMATGLVTTADMATGSIAAAAMTTGSVATATGSVAAIFMLVVAFLHLVSTRFCQHLDRISSRWWRIRLAPSSSPISISTDRPTNRLTDRLTDRPALHQASDSLPFFPPSSSVCCVRKQSNYWDPIRRTARLLKFQRAVGTNLTTGQLPDHGPVAWPRASRLTTGQSPTPFSASLHYFIKCQTFYHLLTASSTTRSANVVNELARLSVCTHTLRYTNRKQRMPVLWIRSQSHK